MKKQILSFLVLGFLSIGAQASAVNTAMLSFGVSASNECPAGFPLNCGNGRCCPSGATLYCPQMEPTPCFNPDTMSPEQLKTLSDNCNPLLSCG